MRYPLPNFQGAQQYVQKYKKHTTYVPLFLIAGSAILLFFINLSGGVNSKAFKHLYWSQTHTYDVLISDFQVVRWTNYGICEGSTGENTNCIKHIAAYPYSPKDNFGESYYLPEEFIKQRDTFYYLSRFSYVFFLIGLVFTLFALMPTFLSVCFIVPGWATYLLSLPVLSALFFVTLATILQTAAHAKGIKAFKDMGFPSHLGSVLFGISWASSIMLILAYIILIRLAEKR